jgi:hypothetical protein
MTELSYKDEIEALKEEPDFEARGDALYLAHPDDEARLEWAFYRPSGSHPDQVSDKNVMVSVMAFNHSRLGALERFTRLHDEVIAEPRLRVKVRNRSRMLFRAMVDNDFTELVAVLERYPVFLDLACDQMVNGRIWNEIAAEPAAASRFLELAGEAADARVIGGLKKRLRRIEGLGPDKAKGYLEGLCSQAQNLHSLIRKHFAAAYERWLEQTSLHPLQKIVWQKQIDQLKGISKESEKELS